MTTQAEVQGELAAIEVLYMTWLTASKGLSAEAKGRVVSWLVDKINSDYRAVQLAPQQGGASGAH